MTVATLGFIFSRDLKHVLLMEKQRPAGHEGKLNGLGGKCEDSEGTLDCMVREAEEEAGIQTTTSDWKLLGIMNWRDWQVELFALRLSGPKVKIVSAVELTEGRVQWYRVDNLPDQVLTNLPWLIPLAIDILTNDAPPVVKIHYEP